MILDDYINEIKRIAKDNKLVLFIGAGVSNNFGYPTWTALVRQFDEAIHYSDNLQNKQYTSDEMLKIPQYAYLKDKDLYRDILTKNFPLSSETDNSILRPLLLLKPAHIITTNYDNLIEQALNESIGENDISNRIVGQYQIIREDSDWINADKQHYLIKMHGDIFSTDKIVLKEDDYLNYSNNYILTETFIKSLLINYSFLFVGYQLGDNNLKLIMSWVDNIIKSSGKEITKQHYFINAQNRLNTYETEYYKAKNIKVLEYEDLPKDFKFENTRYSNPLGKSLNAMCNYIEQKNPFIHTEEEYIKMLNQAIHMELLDCKSLMKMLDIPDYCYSIIDGRCIFSQHINDFPNNIITRAYQKKTEFYNMLNTVFEKTNISEIDTTGLAWKNNSYRTSISEKFMNFEFCQLESYQSSLNQNVPIQKLQYLFLKRFLKYDYKERDELLSAYNNLVYLFKQEQDIFHQIICDHNRFLVGHSERLQCFSTSEILNEEQKMCYALLEDYINDRFNKLYYKVMTLKTKEKNRFNAYTNSITYEQTSIKNVEYKELRFQLFDILTYFINNSIYFTSLNGGDGYISNLSDVITEFNELALLYISPNSKMNKYKCCYERTPLNQFNIYLLLYFTENLEHMIKKMSISNFMLGNDIVDYVITILNNTLEYTNNSTIMGRLRQIIENGVTILNATEIPNKRINDIMILYVKILSIIIDFDTDYLLSMNNNFINKILSTMAVFTKKYEKDIDYKILYDWLIEFLKSANTLYKLYIIYNFDLIGIISKIVNQLNNDTYFEDKDIQTILDFCINTKPEFYDSLIIRIYNLSSKDIREKIYKDIMYKRNILESTNLYLAIANKIIPYEYTIDRWVSLCKNYHEGSRKNFILDNPFICLVRLYENNFINDLTPYKSLIGKNLWFDFVYYPELFDFNNFDTNWSSWLTLDKYIKHALESKDIMKAKYEKAMNNGPTELEKKIYYKYFCD